MIIIIRLTTIWETFYTTPVLMVFPLLRIMAGGYKWFIFMCYLPSEYGNTVLMWQRIKYTFWLKKTNKRIHKENSSCIQHDTKYAYIVVLFRRFGTRIECLPIILNLSSIKHCRFVTRTLNCEFHTILLRISKCLSF